MVLESVLLTIGTAVAKTGIGWWRDSQTRKQAEEEWVAAAANTLNWVATQGFHEGQDGWKATSGLFRETDFISTWSVPGARASSISIDGSWPERGPSIDHVLDHFDEELLSRLAALLPAPAQIEFRISELQMGGLKRNFAAVRDALIDAVVNLSDPLRPGSTDVGSYLTHASWSSSRDMALNYQPTDDHEAAMETIGTLAIDSPENVHIRVLGDAGIGKTRLVLEAIRKAGIADNVFYFSSYEKLSSSPLASYLANEPDHGNIILVCDECDAVGARDVWNQLANAGTDLVFISISNEKDVGASSDRIHQVDAPVLGSEQIQKIFDEKNVPPDVSNHYVEFCEGSPRWADLIATNLVSESPDPLKMDDELSIVVERAIAGRDETTSDVGRNRITVAEFLSLFRKFGYQGAYAEEGRSIAKLISAKTAGISEVEFAQAVDSLRSRRILQGDSTLYLSPRPLHVALWKTWWKSYEQIFDFEEFSGYFVGNLSTWFEEMFVYANNSRAADRSIEHLFGDNGTFADNDALKDPRKAELFLVLAGVKPAQALEHVENFVKVQSPDQLREYVSGRRSVIWALEKIAVWRDLFPRASQVLMKLAISENETISNNATGVYSSLFAIGQGQVANTEAPATDRLALIKAALDSEDPEVRKLGLSSARSMLRTRGHFRMIGPEHQAFSRIPKLWQPTKWDELLDPWKTVWNLLDTKRADWSGEESQSAADVLLSRSRDFAQIEPLAPLVVASFKSMISDDRLDYRRVIDSLEQTLHYDGESLSEDVLSSLTKIRDEAVGSSFRSLMRRYVGMNLLEDNYDSDGNKTGRTETVIAELAEATVKDPEVLAPELEWLLDPKADNAFAFGYQLGKLDESKTIFNIILDGYGKSAPDASPVLICGYLRNIRENGTPDEFVSVLAEQIRGRGMVRYIPEIIWRSGELNDDLGQLVLDSLREADLPPEHLRMFRYGGVSSGLSVDAFESWLTFMANAQTDEAIITAVELAAMYLHRRRPDKVLSAEILERILTSPVWFRKRERMSWGGGVDHDWANVAEVMVSDHPKQTNKIASVLVSNFGVDGTILQGFQSPASPVLRSLLESRPQLVWPMIAAKLGPPIDVLAFHLKSWLTGDIGFSQNVTDAPILSISRDALWEWVDEDVDKRSWYLASFIPRVVDPDLWTSSLARAVLVRYGSRDDVVRNLRASFATEGWTGPASLHHIRRREQIEKLLDNEDDLKARNFLNVYLEDLQRQIETELENEERD